MRVFLDTNVYIIGFTDETSPEARILQWTGIAQDDSERVEVIVSTELFDEIRRVGKRLFDKDWVGAALAFIWHRMELHYVVINGEELRSIIATGLIPREDAEVYCTARTGQAHYFVSANHKLVAALVEHTGDFACLTPQQFVNKYLML